LMRRETSARLRANSWVMMLVGGILRRERRSILLISPALRPVRFP
jgi:hypothetical protein